jgi:two-component system response regulator AtoC
MPFLNPVPFNLQSIIDATDNGFVVIDKDYNIIAANNSYCKSYGIDSDTIVGHKCHQVSHRSDVPCHLNGEDCPHKKVFEARQPYQVLHIHYDSDNQEEHVRIKGSPLYSTDGELYLGEIVFPVAKSEDLTYDKQQMLGSSPAFLACIEEMSGAATSNVPVLLNGESGVGKKLAANFIHNKSNRKAHPCVSIDCTAISEGIFESELFGHERGAFTGCIGRRNGLIESAEKGTLFLDEIGEVPLALQGRLLRALETGNYRRLGGREDLYADVRIICSTHNNLRKMVDDGTFRADLYYRIAGFSITIPPLRERGIDIEPLIKTMLEKNRSHADTVCRISDDALEMLKNYDFPGNIRELRNIMKKAIAISTNGIVTPAQLQLSNFANIYLNPLADRRKYSRDKKTNTPNTSRSLSDIEATHIESLLHQHDGHRARVADELCISERTLYRKLKQYNLQDVGKNRVQDKSFIPSS